MVESPRMDMVHKPSVDTDTSSEWKQWSGGGFRWHPFHLGPGQEMHGHRHGRAHLCFVEAGGFEEYDGTCYVSCEPGTVRLSQPGTRHFLASGSLPCRGHVLELLPGWGYEDRRFWQNAGSHRFFHHTSIQQRGEALLACLGKEAKGSPLQAHLVLRSLLARLSFVDKPLPSWHKDVQEHLDRHFLAPSLSTTLARDVGLHRTHFARQFFRVFGCSISEAVRIRRLDYAHTLLAETEGSIAEIAHEAGFADQSHLTRYFRQYFGVPPRAYRLRYRPAR